jgi:hypothetical protein
MIRFFFFVIVYFLAMRFLCAADAKNQFVQGDAGQLYWIVAGEKRGDFVPFAADAHWNLFQPKEEAAVGGTSPPFSIKIGSKLIRGQFDVSEQEERIHATWAFTATDKVAFNSLGIASNFPLAALVGGKWKTDTAQGIFPPNFSDARLFDGPVRDFAITFADGNVLQFSFSAPIEIILQDNRQWTEATFSLRFNREGKMAAEEKFTVDVMIGSPGGVSYDGRELPASLQPVTLLAGEEWIPIKTELDIIPGSALDLSGLGFSGNPCGAKGRIIATDEGHFACADEPKKKLRFYGVNFCFDALFLPKEQVDQVLDRIVRLGYNSVRVHHFESDLMTGRDKTGFNWDQTKVDQLDYFMAGCSRRGLWITIDLHVNREVSAKQIGLTGGRITLDRYRMLMPVYEPAFQDWVVFARKFLDRVNPYTKARIVDDPALAWISLVNEAPYANNWSEVKRIPEWTAAWNRWLAERYPNRADLEAALAPMSGGEDPKQDTVPLPDFLSANLARGRVARVFVAEMEKRTFERMRDFLRNELKCQALLTNMNNAGSSIAQLHLARAEFDYVDEHFYVDHPNFLERPWRLPSFCPNTNPVAQGAPGGVISASVRLYGKPFTVTEYCYSGPGRFRGVGGILTGSLAAIQDWDALWRFAYSHGRINLFSSGRMGYFDLACDPLSQAADRLALFLYLRGDLHPSPHRVAMILPRDVLQNPSLRLNLSGIQSAAWKVAIGSLIADDAGKAADNTIPIPADSDDSIVSAALKKIVPIADDNHLIRSETGELTMDLGIGRLTIDTERSAGGYAEPEQVIDASRAGVKIDAITTGATVFVNSLDAAPIRNSKRLLVTHLTDLQNTGIRYSEGTRQTVLAWGELPHLVRNGSATVTIQLSRPEKYTVWAIATSGRRIEKITAVAADGRLVFNTTVAGGGRSKNVLRNRR